MIKKQLFQKIIDFGLIFILIIFPLSLNIILISPKDPGHPIIAVNFSLADMFIGIILMLWLLKLSIYKEWKKVKFPPTPFLIFAGIAIITFVNALLIIQWLKGIIQVIEYFVLLYMLLKNNLKSFKLSVIKNAFFISSSIILAIAFIQHKILGGDPYLVRGLFENDNILGTFLCLVVPFIYVEMLDSTQTIRKVWMALLLILSLIVLTSGSAILSILIGLLVVNWFYSKKMLIRFVISIILMGAFYPFIMPAKNVTAIKNFISIYEQGSISENYYHRLTMLENIGKITIFQKKLGDNNLYIITDRFLNVILPKPDKGERYKELEGKQQIKNRYLEMQASMNVISENALLGIGMGNYQNNIGTSFHELPKVNTAEPNQNNTYLLIATTMGLLGLAALIWILLHSLISTRTFYKESIDKEKRTLYLMLLGSLVAGMIEGFFSYLLVSSLLIPIVFILYLSHLDFQYVIHNTVKFKKKYSYILLVLGGLILLCFVIITSFEKIGSKEYIWFEAEDADEINYPLKIIDINSDDVSNKKAIQTLGSENVHRATTGYAVYNLSLTSAGKYFVWARCFWPHACANSFTLSMNQGGKTSFGGDGVLSSWHWILGGEFELKSGKNKLLLWNNELGAIVDRFLVTKDNDFRPSGLGESSELIVDFDANVLPSEIKYDRNYWSVINDTGFNNALYSLPIKNNKPPQKILIDEGSSLKHVFMVSVKFKKSPNNSMNAQLYFNYLNEGNFYMLNFTNNNIKLIKKTVGILSELNKLDINLRDNTYYDFMIIRDDSLTKVKLSGKTIFSIKNTLSQTGKIGKSGKVGIGSASGDIYFDNITRLVNTDFSYSQNFHYKIIFPTYVKPETMFNYSEIYKVGGFHYWILNGNWKGFWPSQLTNHYSYVESLCGKKIADKEALLVIGQYFWENYSFQCCIKNSIQCKSGLCFCYQDEKNYYLLKLDNTKKINIVQIVLIKDGKESIIAEKKLPLNSLEDWIKLEIKTINSRIVILLDDQGIFDLYDNTFKDGKVGFWNSSDQYVSYDDVAVLSIKEIDRDTSNIYNYNFSYAQQSSRDLSDWKLKNSDVQIYSNITKKLFHESIITHKKQFNGDIFLSLSADMPNDVGAFLRLNSIAQQRQIEYTCQFYDNYVSIIKNGQIKQRKKISMHGSSFQLGKADKTLELFQNNISVLKWEDNECLNDFNLSVGFCGVGAGNISLSNIVIQKLGSKNK